MVLINSIHNYDFKYIFLNLSFGLNSLIKYDKHIGTRQLILDSENKTYDK